MRFALSLLFVPALVYTAFRAVEAFLLTYMPAPKESDDARSQEG